MPKLAVITGASNGIGFITARELARSGYQVVMLCRNPSVSEQACKSIRAAVPEAATSSIYCDLEKLETVRSVADHLLSSHPPPSLLINNAGVAPLRVRRKDSGLDRAFSINHLGHFLLTELLRRHLASDARILTVASRAHYRGTLDLCAVADPSERISATQSYARSKLANVLHSLALQRRLSTGTVTANCLHPGVVATNLLPRWLVAAKRIAGSRVLTVERGSETTLHLAISSSLKGVGGRYYDEFQRPQDPSAIAATVELQEALWAKSLEWVGLPPES